MVVKEQDIVIKRNNPFINILLISMTLDKSYINLPSRLSFFFNLPPPAILVS